MLLLRLILAAALAATSPATTPSPDARAEGFGAAARGGDGGRVITVTTLADAGPGSLRAALGEKGPRVIRFAVGGTIDLGSPLRCTEGRLTIDGASAPAPGVTLFNHGLQFRGDCDDLIVRHLRIRVTTGGATGDGLLFWGRDGGTVERVLVDHCSISGATDENINVWGSVRDLTIQWTLIAGDNLGPATRPTAGNAPDPRQGQHHYGLLAGQQSDRITVHHCLFANCADRSPKVTGGGTYDVVNNLVFNWTNNNATKVEDGAKANVVSNLYIPGPLSRPQRGCIFLHGPDATRAYLSGNVCLQMPDGEQPWSFTTWYEPVAGKTREHRPAPAIFRADKPFPSPPLTIHPAADLLGLIRRHAGPAPRDAHDRALLDQLPR